MIGTYSIHFFRSGIIISYFIATILFVLSFTPNWKKVNKIAIYFTAFGFTLHTLELIVKFVSQTPFSSGGFYFSIMAWTLILSFLILWYYLRHDVFSLIGAPFSFLLYHVSMVFSIQPTFTQEFLVGPLFILHFASLFLSIALLFMAAGAGCFHLYFNKQLKQKQKLTSLSQITPSLFGFDRVNHIAACVGFPLYTLGIFCGFLWANRTFGHFFLGDPKEILAIFIWIIFAVFFYQRFVLGLKGSKLAKLAIILFLLCCISFSMNFLLHTHHAFNVGLD